MYKVGDLVQILPKERIKFPSNFKTGVYSVLVNKHGLEPKIITSVKKEEDFAKYKYSRVYELVGLSSNPTWLVPSWMLSDPISYKPTCFGPDGRPKRKIERD